MNEHLQTLFDSIQDNNGLSSEQKETLVQSLKAVNRELEIVSFKLERTEKVKRTTAILLEETIAELEQKRKMVEESKLALEKSLEELKAAQAQLIQSEKLASLGSLTAGIAHEIKNPLNFVNNFSEVSSELLDEMVEELERGDQEEVLAIVEDLKQNLDKIKEHGKRADSIVRGMLMHSRGSSGEREKTDLNALCDEYLRLAYHGLRAMDPSFNVGLETIFDKNLPFIEIAPQEMGRVLLNLITNAFHACADRIRMNNSDVDHKTHEEYKPKVSIETKLKNGNIQITVSDNGTGIPETIKNKIFQPFFTTKPTGSGTGLGLSISYDIIKAHQGKIHMHTETGKGTTFTIQLPLN